MDNSAVLAALGAIEDSRRRVILNVAPDVVIPEVLTAASFAGRKFWYDKGYAIPAGGSCALSKIEAEGLT